MVKNNEEVVLTLSELKKLTGVSDATVSRLRGEKQPIKKFDISLLQKRVNHFGIKVVTEEDLRLLIIYIIYSNIPGSNGKPKQMKDIIEELNIVLTHLDYAEVIGKIKQIFEERIRFLDRVMEAEGNGLIQILNSIKASPSICDKDIFRD